jgi:hypothetical protein
MTIPMRTAVVGRHDLSHDFTAFPTSPETKGNASPGRIAELAEEILHHLGNASQEIATLNDETRFLSINARIEAARAGGRIGAAFGVVAQAIQDLSGKTTTVARTLSERTGAALSELARISSDLEGEMLGSRFTSIADHIIDVIDRNLYERTCDCRWWATDESLVSALTLSTPASFTHASRRLGVILDSYTVYTDLVLCDLAGRVVAHGRPNHFATEGMNCRLNTWFREAVDTRDGTEFAFESAHHSPLVKNRKVLVYSGAVRQDGQTNGRVIGVLGALFDWESLGQKLVEDLPLNPHEVIKTRCLLIDEEHNILADTERRSVGEVLKLATGREFLMGPRGHREIEVDGQPTLLAFSTSRGFETYATGWKCVILHTLGQ